MRNFFLICILSFLGFNAAASCIPGYNEVIILIIPDNYPQETTWSVTDSAGNVIASGTDQGDTLCIPVGACSLFTINDSHGDGIFTPGGFWVSVNGILLASGNAFGYSYQLPFGCASGMYCNNPIPLTYGQYQADFDDSWYSFTPDTTGMYLITTCALNTCDTKIWVYTYCNGIMNSETPMGAYAYNDSAACGGNAELNLLLFTNQQYLIRIGDANNNCNVPVLFNFSYIGTLTGCMDPAACNFDPLAMLDDGSCIFPPNPLCAGPDLQFDAAIFNFSISLLNYQSGQCDIDEGCVTGYGNRYVITFTSQINNTGTLDYVIGDPSTNPTMFNLNNCHGHAHYEGYGDYRLYDVNGNLIPAGHKNGFCVMDLCGTGQYNCSTMGISAGCFDAYGAGTQCQWIDITNVPNGDYRLAAVVNPLHLPDAMGHYESNFINNTIQTCLQITRNASNVPSFTILPNCNPFVDCAGVAGGLSIPDCDGVCNGPSLYGNVFPDNAVDTLDIGVYLDLLSYANPPLSNCNDLNADTALSIYDASLVNWCFYNGNANNNPGGSIHNHCSFPRNILNPADTCYLGIMTANFTSNYLDIAVLNKTADLSAFEFEISGIEIQDVVSLTNPVQSPFVTGFNRFNNHVFGISMVDSTLIRDYNFQVLCRVYFSAITDTQICINSIRDIVNSNAERTITSIYGNCFQSTPTTTGLQLPDNPSDLMIQPNPVSENAMVYLQSEGKNIRELVVSDITGRKIMSPGSIQPGEWTSINFSGLPSGLYFLNVMDESNRTIPVKFVKLK